MTNAETHAAVLTGKTMHCFTDHPGPEKQFPEVDQVLRALAAEQQEV